MSKTFPLRSAVMDFTPYSAGLSIDEIQQKYGLASVIKMASNENPLGTSSRVQEVLRQKAASAFRYAQSGNPKLVAAIATYLGIDPEHIVVGNGSNEVIDLLIRSCPTPGVHNIVSSLPSFSVYELQSKLCGTEFRTVPLRSDFSFDWKGLRDAVDDNTALLFLTTPDNPSGYCPPVEDVRNFAKSLPPTCLLVIDEAYMDLSDNPQKFSLFSECTSYPNLVLLRTFSKSFGLAGLRLGYGIMPKDLARQLCSVRIPFSVNLMAEAAGIAALEDKEFYQATLDTVHTGKAYLHEELTQLGCTVYPSQTNFLMIALPQHYSGTATTVFEQLLQQGIIIRALTSYHLPQHLRISIGTMDENKQLIACLRKVLSA